MKTAPLLIPILLFALACTSVEPGPILPAESTVERLATGFRFTEGPALAPDGSLYFSDIPNARVHRWSSTGELTTVREDSGGANGLFFDHDGRLLCCEGKARRLTAVDSEGAIQVLADEYEGRRLNSPNDLWIDPTGGLYFTDPRYGQEDDLEQDGFHVYYLSSDRSQLTRIVDDLVKPNGIVGTIDGRTLYIADAGDNKTYVYRIAGPGHLVDRRLFVEQGSDGMTLDERGNLYLTRKAVDVYDSDGKPVLTIETPERPANVVFGGPDGKTLFITARTSLYAVEMAVAGQRYP